MLCVFYLNILLTSALSVEFLAGAPNLPVVVDDVVVEYPSPADQGLDFYNCCIRNILVHCYYYFADVLIRVCAVVPVVPAGWAPARRGWPRSLKKKTLLRQAHVKKKEEKKENCTLAVVMQRKKKTKKPIEEHTGLHFRMFIPEG